MSRPRTGSSSPAASSHRSSSASATGVHAAAGVAIHMGSLAAKLEGEITSYSWTFSQQDPNADGASDKVFGFAALLAYQY